MPPSCSVLGNPGRELDTDVRPRQQLRRHGTRAEDELAAMSSVRASFKSTRLMKAVDCGLVRHRRRGRCGWLKPLTYMKRSWASSIYSAMSMSTDGRDRRGWTAPQSWWMTSSVVTFGRAAALRGSLTSIGHAIQRADRAVEKQPWARTAVPPPQDRDQGTAGGPGSASDGGGRRLRS